ADRHRRAQHHHYLDNDGDRKEPRHSDPPGARLHAAIHSTDIHAAGVGYRPDRSGFGAAARPRSELAGQSLSVDLDSGRDLLSLSRHAQSQIDRLRQCGDSGGHHLPAGDDLSRAGCGETYARRRAATRVTASATPVVGSESRSPLERFRSQNIFLSDSRRQENGRQENGVGLRLTVVSAMPHPKEITEKTEKTEQTENFHGFPFVPSFPYVP